MANLTDVLWIGGPAGAGKTTVARLLARRNGLRLYSGDTRTWDHRDRALAAGYDLPERGPGDGYDRQSMIIDDLLALPQALLIVAEGGQLSPTMPELGEHAILAVWLVPSRATQVARLARRHPDGVPDAYLASWQPAVDELAATTVATLTVDGRTIDETVAAVERCFAERIAAGPTAESPAERRDLIRAANRALIRQYAGPSSKPKVPIDPERTVRVFDCECAAPACSALVSSTISAAAVAVAATPPSILAPGHG